MNSTEKVFSETFENLVNKKNPKIVVAFSGGCDSLALLVLLSKTIPPKNLIPCYVNHRIRCNGELEKEIELNRLNCKKLGLELGVRDLGENTVKNLADERKGGLEEAARILRYRELNCVLDENSFDFIATAHHKDDQIETLVMRMVNNSPAVSFRGIAEKNGKVIRPLLPFYKEELATYLKLNDFEWSTDSTNTDNSILRNKIRNEILPSFRASDVDFDQKMLAVRQSVCDECNSFEFEVTDCIDLEWFNSLSGIKKELVIYACWDKYVGGILPQSLIERVEEAPKDMVISANGGTFSVYNGKIYLVANRDNSVFDNFSCPLENTTIPGNISIEVCEDGDKDDIFIEAQRIDETFRIRFAKDGDKILLKDGTKMVGKLLQDNKIPAVLRNRVPVLVSGNEIVAVFGSVYGGKNRIAQRFRTSLAHDKYYKYIISKRY